MRVNDSRLGVPIRRYYFDCQRKPTALEILFPTAFLDCYQSHKPGRFFFTDDGHTLITDLTLSEDQLFARLSRKTRNEIRRYERGSDYVLNENPTLQAFLPAYNSFAASRGLSQFTEKDAVAYGAENILIFSMDRAEQAEIFDLYLFDSNIKSGRRRVTGFLSCSPIDHIQDKKQRRQLSIARRYLLWFSILYFKRAGFEVYDWGGYAPDDPNPVVRHISEFKQSFKGAVIPVYHYYSPAYRVMTGLHGFLKKLRGTQ